MKTKNYKKHYTEKEIQERYDKMQELMNKIDAHKKERDKKRKLNWVTYSNVLFYLIIFSLGMLIGVFMGEQAGEYKAFEKMAIVMNGANINMTINLNETKLVDLAKVQFKDTLEESLNKRNLVCVSCNQDKTVLENKTGWISDWSEK